MTGSPVIATLLLPNKFISAGLVSDEAQFAHARFAFAARERGIELHDVLIPKALHDLRISSGNEVIFF